VKTRKILSLLFVVLMCLCGCTDAQEELIPSETVSLDNLGTTEKDPAATSNEWYHKFRFDDSGVDVNIRTEQDVIAGLHAVSERYQYSGYLEFHIYTKGAVNKDVFSGVPYYELIDDDLFYTLKIKIENVDGMDSEKLAALARLPAVTKISVTGPIIFLPE